MDGDGGAAGRGAAAARLVAVPHPDRGDAAAAGEQRVCSHGRAEHAGGKGRAAGRHRRSARGAARAGAGALRDRGEHGVPQRPFSLGAGGAAAHARRRRGPGRARDAEARDGRYTESHADDGFFLSDRQRAGTAGVHCGAEQRSDADRERDDILSAGVRQRRAAADAERPAAYRL